MDFGVSYFAVRRRKARSVYLAHQFIGIRDVIMKAIAPQRKKSYFFPECLAIVLCIVLLVVIAGQTSSQSVAVAGQDTVAGDSEVETAENPDVPETSEISTAVPETTAAAKLSPSYKISVPYISQENVLPTGCEIISAVMVLRYYHYDLSVDDFIDQDLDQEDFTTENGVYYGPHPSEAFVGNPYRPDGLGCYAPVIRRALSRVLVNETALDTTGTSLDDLVSRYIVNDQPVLIWASMNMIPLENGFTYTVESTGEKFTWPANEHCLVLIGYDQKAYYFNDPYESNGVKGFSKSVVSQRFADMGLQSVVVVKD